MSDIEQLPLSDEGDTTDPTWYLLTNALNLRAWMSRRLAFGRVGYDKYYTDVPDLVDGDQVVFPGPPGAELLDHVTSEASDLVPALVEVDGSLRELAGTSVPARLATVIHESHLRRIHLPTEAAVDDFASRAFDNVPSQLEVAASPELFDGGRWSIADLPPEGDEDRPEDLSESDRRSGGLLGISAATRCTPTEVSTLTALLSGAAPRRLDRREPHWLFPDASEDDETRVFKAIERVLLDTDAARDWRPPKVLDRFQAAVGDLELTADVRGTAEKYFDRMRGIVSLEVDFEPLRPGGLRPLKAALLVLLRRELERQLEWDRSESGADPAEARTAAYYAGILSRRSRLPLKLRPDLLDRLLADGEAEQAGGLGAPSFDRAKLEVSWTERDNSHVCTISLDGETVVERVHPGASTTDRIRATVAAGELDEMTALPLAEAAGWDDLMWTMVGPIDRIRVVAEKKGRAMLRVEGRADVEHGVDADSVLERLATVDAEQLPEAVVALLASPSPWELEELEP